MFQKQRKLTILSKSRWRKPFLNYYSKNIKSLISLKNAFTYRALFYVLIFRSKLQYLYPKMKLTTLK